MEVAHMFGMRRLAHWVHDRTLPQRLKQSGALRMLIEAGEYFDRPYLTEKELKRIWPHVSLEGEDA
jgi:hypothetical protein